jgi:hypothetical protein
MNIIITELILLDKNAFLDIDVMLTSLPMVAEKHKSRKLNTTNGQKQKTAATFRSHIQLIL